MAELKRISILLQFVGTARPTSPLQSISKTEAISFCPTHRISSLTAVSCSGFLDFPATGKLGVTPDTRAARTAWSDCKSAPTCSRPMQKQRKPQRTQETINRFQNLYKFTRKSCFLKNLRNDILRAVPLSRRTEYYEYLNSKEWRDLRARVWERDGYKCTKCGRKSHLQGHHVRYGKDIRKVDMKWVITLCKPCHEALHREKARKRKEARKLRKALGHVAYLIFEFDAF